MDALEAFGRDGFHAGQPHALGGPVARRALAVVGAGDDDQRLLALHVGLDRLPHARDRALWLDAGQRAGLDLAVLQHHLVLQRRVGKGRALRREVIAAVRGVGIEVLLRQAHLREVLAGRAVQQDGVGWRQVVGGDVVAQHRERPHALERALAGQRAFPVRRTADIGALRAPVVQRADLFVAEHLEGEHRVVDLAELLGLHAGGDDGVDLLIARPDVLQGYRLAVLVGTQNILLDVEADGARDGVRDDQRRRSEEGLLGVGMDAAIEVAVAGQHRRGVQVTVDAGGAGKGDDAETELLQLRQQPGFFQIQLNGLGTRRQRRLHPGPAGQAARIGVAGQQAGGNHVARIAGVGAAGDGGDNYGAIRHLAGNLFPFAGDAARRQIRGRQTLVRVGRARHVADHGRQVECQNALVFGGLE